MDIKYTDIMRPEEITIDLIWKTFVSKVYPHISADSDQYREMKTVFYAGFVEMFKVMNDISTELPEDRAFVVLGRIQSEAHSFFNEMFARIMQGKEG